MSDIKIKVGAEKDCVQTITVEFPSSKVKQAIEAAFEKVRGQAKMPGFRPGKTPIELVKANFQDSAHARAQDDLMREGVNEAIKQKKINAVDAPVITKAEFNPDKAFQFEFFVEVAPTFKAGGYKGLKLNKKSEKATDENFQKTLTQIADANARLVESKKETVDATSFAVIDYEVFVDGTPIEGAKADNFLVDMSAPQAITGLADGLTGLKTGAEKEVKVTFPADSPAKDLAGKEGTFKVKLNAIKERVTPKLDDEFAKDLGLESFEVLKARVRENLENELKENSRRDLKNQVVEALLNENKFGVPNSLVEKQAQYLKAHQQERLERQGFPKDQVVKLLTDKQAEIKLQAEKEIRLQYILNAVGETEKIEVSDADVDAKIADMTASMQTKDKANMEKALRGRYTESLRSDLRDAKVFDWIISNAKVKEV